MRKTITRALVTLLCLAMLASCVLTASAAGDFSDVKSSNWFYDYVTYMADKGIINGYPDGTFGPNKNVNRSEFVTMIVNTFGLTAEKSINFSDVSESNWYHEYYSKAAAQGFLGEVFTGSTMRPTDDLTREEAASLLMAYLDYPEDEKASTSEFEDYTDISTAYRNYVLQAAKAGIIVGFEEDGDYYFRPDETLTRAQAAKILSVAAGTIADSAVSNDLEFDESDNLIVTKACTIRNLTIPGNVIITEGVSTGTVSFVNCEIEGTVSLRGKATVSFSDGAVEKLNIDVASASVELKQAVEVAELNAYYSSASVDFYTNAVVEEFNVVSGSTGVTVSGTSGEIETLNVKANSFSSTITPDECNIDSSISATVGGVAYKDGVKGSIGVIWANDNEYLTFETYKDGSIKYYYTASSSAPSKTSFTTNYNNADHKDTVTAKAGKSDLATLSGESVSLEDFPYVVAALVDGTTVTSTPVVINREGSKYGFTVSPTLTLNGTYDQLKCTAVKAGTLYYYYTEDGTVPETYKAAENAYKTTLSAIKGTVDCTASAKTVNLKTVTAVENYGYCVFFYLGDDDTQYQPVIVERPYLTNGLSDEPYILISSEKDGKDTLVITAPSSATVKILYTNSTLNYTVSSFTTAYNAANKTPAAGEVKLAYSGSATANKEAKITLAKSDDVSTYKYAVVQYGSNLPIRVDRITDVDGFEGTTLPTVLKTTGKDIIVFNPIDETSYGSVVKYMYVSTNKGFTSDSFETTYKTIADNVKGEFSISDGTALEKESTKQSSNISEGYVAFMYISGGRAYQPVTVARSDAGTGFVGTPTASYDVDSATATLNFNAKVSFTLEYMILPKKNISTQSLTYMFESRGRDLDDIDEDGNTNDEFKIYTYNSTIVHGANSGTIDGVNKGDKYIALRAQKDSIKYTPLIIDISNIDDGIKKDSIIYVSSKNGVVKIELTASTDAIGKTFEYYYTKTEPKTTAAYNTIFKGSDPSGSVPITDGNMIVFEAGNWLDMADYVYLAYRVVDNAGNSMTPGYVTLPIECRANAHIAPDSTSKGVIHVTPKDTEKYVAYWFFSTTELNLTNDNFLSSYNSAKTGYKGIKNIESSAADMDVEDIQTDFKQPDDGKTVYKYVYVCLKDANGKYYQPIGKAISW